MGFSFFGMPYHWWRTDSVWELHSKYTEKFCFGLRVHMIRWMLTSNFNFFFFFNFFILAILYRVTPMEEAIPDISTLSWCGVKGGGYFGNAMVQRVLELSIKSPSLHPCLWAYFHPLSPLFSGIRKVMKFCLLNLSMKCWNSAFNAQGSREIIIIVRVGAVKIHVAAVEALRKNEKYDNETQFITKIDGFTSFTPLLECSCTYFRS
jgi:hypothetical protein